MNDDHNSVDEQLAALVESVVRPIWATRSRKQIMREELLGHVSAVFEEEYARLDDEAAALAAARARFGASEALEQQLQTSVPVLGDWFLLFQKELPMARWIWLSAVFAVAVGPAIILPAAAKYRDEGIFMAFPFVLGGLILLAGLGMVGYGIMQRLTRAS